MKFMRQFLAAMLCIGLLSCFGDGMVPERQNQVVQTFSVTGGDLLELAGGLSSTGLSRKVVNAVAYSLRFKDAEGSGIVSGTLPESADGHEYLYLDGCVEPYRYRKLVMIPDGAVSVEVSLLHHHGGGRYWLSDQQVRCVKTPVLSRPFTGTWFWRQIVDFCHEGGMSFVSLRFVFFVAITLLVYFSVPLVLRHWVLLLGSVFFYALFNVRSWIFLGFSVASVYVAARIVRRVGRQWLIAAVLVITNIGILLYAKYAGLFFKEASIIVPLGISFYTLQAVAYFVDVYRGDIEPERNFFKLLLFLSFFPAVIQGPISRYGQLGSQLWKPHRFSCDALRDGLQLALWGFFKKLVIADRAGVMVDQVFSSGSGAEGLVVVVGVLLYSIQIYTDFSGCVDISRGISQCFGVDLMRNFNHPYFSESVAEFWRRWHVSLSTWLRDYVYIPLGGNRHGVWRKYLNVLIVFAVSGLWHGTGVNFFIWGLLHGFYQICGAATKSLRAKTVLMLGIDGDSFSMRVTRRIVTFLLVGFAWLFFRADSFSTARTLMARACRINPWTLCDGTLFGFGLDGADWVVLSIAVLILLVVSMLQERMQVRAVLNRQVLWFRWGVELAGLAAVIVFGMYGPGYNSGQFIYMQF